MSKAPDKHSVESLTLKIRGDIEKLEHLPEDIKRAIVAQLGEIKKLRDPVEQFEKLISAHNTAKEMAEAAVKGGKTDRNDSVGHYKLPKDGYATGGNLDRLLRGRLAENKNIQPLDLGHNVIGENIDSAPPVILHSPVHMSLLGEALETAHDLPLHAQAIDLSEKRHSFRLEKLQLKPILIPINVGGNAETGGNHWVSVYLEPVDKSPTLDKKPEYTMVFFDPMATAKSEALTGYATEALAQLNQKFEITKTRDLSAGQQHKTDKGSQGYWSCGFWALEFAERAAASGHSIPSALMPRSLAGISEDGVAKKTDILAAYQAEISSYEGKGLTQTPPFSRNTSSDLSRSGSLDLGKNGTADKRRFHDKRRSQSAPAQVDKAAARSKAEKLKPALDKQPEAEERTRTHTPSDSTGSNLSTDDSSNGSPILSRNGSPRPEADPAIQDLANDITARVISSIYTKNGAVAPDIEALPKKAKKLDETVISLQNNLVAKFSATLDTETTLSGGATAQIVDELVPLLTPGFAFRVKKDSAPSVGISKERMKEALEATQAYLTELDIPAMEEAILTENAQALATQEKEARKTEKARLAKIEAAKTPRERWETSSAKRLETIVINHADETKNQPTQVFNIDANKQITFSERPVAAEIAENEAAQSTHIHLVQEEQMRILIGQTTEVYPPRAVALSAVRKAAKNAEVTLTLEQQNALLDPLTIAIDSLYTELKNYVSPPPNIKDIEEETSATPGKLAGSLATALAASFEATKGAGLDINAALIQTKAPLEAHITRLAYGKKRPEVLQAVIATAGLPEGDAIKGLAPPSCGTLEETLDNVPAKNMRQVGAFLNAVTNDDGKAKDGAFTPQQMVEILTFLADPNIPDSATILRRQQSSPGKLIITKNDHLNQEITQHLGGDVNVLRPLAEFLQISPDPAQALGEARAIVSERVAALPKKAEQGEVEQDKRNTITPPFSLLVTDPPVGSRLSSEVSGSDLLDSSPSTDTLSDEFLPQETLEKVASHLKIDVAGILQEEDAISFTVSADKLREVQGKLDALGKENDEIEYTVKGQKISLSYEAANAMYTELTTDVSRAEEHDESLSTDYTLSDTPDKKAETTTPPKRPDRPSRAGLDKTPDTIPQKQKPAIVRPAPQNARITPAPVRSLNETSKKKDKSLDAAVETFITAYDTAKLSESKDKRTEAQETMAESVKTITKLIKEKKADPSPYGNLFDVMVEVDNKTVTKTDKDGAKRGSLTKVLEKHHGYISQETFDAKSEGFKLQAQQMEKDETDTPESRFILNRTEKNSSGVPSEIRRTLLEIGSEFQTGKETKGKHTQWEQRLAATYDGVMHAAYERIEAGNFRSISGAHPLPLTVSASTNIAIKGKGDGFVRMVTKKIPQTLKQAGIEIAVEQEEIAVEQEEIDASKSTVANAFITKIAKTNQSLLAIFSDVEHGMRSGSNHLILERAEAYNNLSKHFFTDLNQQIKHQVEASGFLMDAVRSLGDAKDSGVAQRDQIESWFEANQATLDDLEQTVLQDLHTNYTHHQNYPAGSAMADKALGEIETRQRILAKQQDARKTQEHTETPPPPSTDTDTVSAGAQQESQPLNLPGIGDGLRSDLEWESRRLIDVKASDGGLAIRTRKGDDAQAMQAELTALGVTTSSVETDTASGMVTLTLNTEQARTLETKTRPTGIGLGLGDPHIRFEDDSVNGGTETRTPTTGSQTPLLPEEMAADLLVDPATSRASQQQLSETSNADADIFANLLDILSEEAGIPSQQDKEAGDTPQQGSNPLNFSELGNSLSKLPTEQTRTGNSGNPPPHATPPSAPPLPSDSSTGSPPPPHVTSRGTDSPPPHVTSRGAGSPPPPGNIDPLAALKREQAELEKELKRLKEDQAKRNADLSALQKEEKGLLAKEDRHREQGKLPIGGNLLGAGVVGIAFLINPIFGLFVLAAALLAVDAKPLYHKTKQADARSSRKSIQRTINNAESERNGHQPEIDDLAEKKTNVLEKITRIEKQQEAEQAQAQVNAQAQAQALAAQQAGYYAPMSFQPVQSGNIPVQQNLPGTPPRGGYPPQQTQPIPFAPFAPQPQQNSNPQQPMGQFVTDEQLQQIVEQAIQKALQFPPYGGTPPHHAGRFSEKGGQTHLQQLATTNTNGPPPISV